MKITSNLCAKCQYHGTIKIDNLYHSTKTAFAFFVAEINENLRAENPYYRQIDVIDEAKEQWKCLTDKSRFANIFATLCSLLIGIRFTLDGLPKLENTTQSRNG